MAPFRCILLTIMLCLAGSVQAQCQHPDAELQAYAFQLNQGSLPGILTTHVKFSVENDHHVQVVLDRGDMPARTLKPLTLKNNVTAPVKSSVYRALIIPPNAAQLAVRIDSSLNAGSKSESQVGNKAYKSSHLGEHGAIILINKNEFDECKPDVSWRYIIAGDDNSVDADIYPQSIRLGEEDFNRLLLGILVRNADEKLSGNTLEVLFLPENQDSTISYRKQMLMSPVEIDVPDELFGVSGINMVRSAPLYFAYQKSLMQLYLPDAIARIWPVNDKLSDVFSLKFKIREQERDGTITAADYLLYEKTLAEFLQESIPIVVNAKSSADNYAQRINDMPDTSLRMKESMEIAVSQRVIDSTQAMVNQTAGEYERIYAHNHNQPEIVPGILFDSAQLINASLEQGVNRCALPSQQYDTGKINVEIANRSLESSGKLYVFYRSFKDPATGLVLVRPYFKWVGDVSSVDRMHNEIVRDHIPVSSCRHRYKELGNFTTEVSHGAIEGYSTIRYEKWICEDHYWICFNGWVPRECRNTIKTRVYGVDKTNKFALHAAYWGDNQVKFILNSDFINLEHVSAINIGNNSLEDVLDNTVKLRWDSAGFQGVASSAASKVLTLEGRGKAVRWSTACAIHQTIDDAASAQDTRE